MSALVSRRSWVQIPPVKFFDRHDRKPSSMQHYTHVGVGQIKSIVYHPTQDFHQPNMCLLNPFIKYKRRFAMTPCKIIFLVVSGSEKNGWLQLNVSISML